MTDSEEVKKRRHLFAEFAHAANFVPENPNYGKLQERLNSVQGNPAFERATKKQVERCNSLNKAFQINGPSMYADGYLRNFLLEYNNRVFKGRGSEQPASFNILRSFVTPDEKAFVLRLLDEKFFQFNLLDYLDFVTGKNASSHIDADNFEELTIYELNSAGSFAQVILPGFDDYVFCGAAIVREGDEITVMGVFGKTQSLFTEGSIVNLDGVSAARREVLGDGPWDLSPESLFNSDSFYPVIALTRIDAKSQRIQAQYIMHESKDIFRVTTDDPAVLVEANFANPKDADKIVQRAISELAQYRQLFDLLYNMLQFPRFLQEKEDDFYIERHPTGFKLRSSSTTMRKVRSTLESKYCPNYREVLTLAQRADCPEVSTLDHLDLRIETSGFWKTLPLDKVGADKHGNPVHGKTWVEQKLSWREDESAANDRDRNQASVSQVAKADDVGFIYVMRSPVHERNIFKIGFTRRDPEDRADDLSSTSGQPDALVVMLSWKVTEPRRIEQAIHKELSKERINSRREFFKAKFETLRHTIEAVIKGMNAQVEAR